MTRGTYKRTSKPQHLRKKRGPVTDSYDSDGRPIGVGGRRRQKTIDDYVDAAQTGKKKK